MMGIGITSIDKTLEITLTVLPGKEGIANQNGLEKELEAEYAEYAYKNFVTEQFDKKAIAKKIIDEISPSLPRQEPQLDKKRIYLSELPTTVTLSGGFSGHALTIPDFDEQHIDYPKKLNKRKVTIKIPKGFSIQENLEESFINFDIGNIKQIPLSVKREETIPLVLPPGWDMSAAQTIWDNDSRDFLVREKRNPKDLFIASLSRTSYGDVNLLRIDDHYNDIKPRLEALRECKLENILIVAEKAWMIQDIVLMHPEANLIVIPKGKNMRSHNSVNYFINDIGIKKITLAVPFDVDWENYRGLICKPGTNDAADFIYNTSVENYEGCPYEFSHSKFLVIE